MNLQPHGPSILALPPVNLFGQNGKPCSFCNGWGSTTALGFVRRNSGLFSVESAPSSVSQCMSLSRGGR